MKNTFNLLKITYLYLACKCKTMCGRQASLKVNQAFRQSEWAALKSFVAICIERNIHLIEYLFSPMYIICQVSFLMSYVGICSTHLMWIVRDLHKVKYLKTLYQGQAINK